MNYLINEEQLDDYITLPPSFNWDIIDQFRGFDHVFKFVPKAVYLTLKESNETEDQIIFDLLTKAAVHYAFVLNIPKLKVHIGGTGIENFEQEKLKPAAWWDVRDLGINFLKLADELLSDVLEKLYNIEKYRTQTPLFSEVTDLFTTPREFDKIFPINQSPEVFQLLQRFIKQAINIKINPYIKGECLEAVKSNDFLKENLKSAVAFFALHYASLLPSFVFLKNAVVIQYEELPWQKSQVISLQEKTIMGQNFMKLGIDHLKIITDYMKENKDDFPCLSSPKPGREIHVRPSGIYL